ENAPLVPGRVPRRRPQPTPGSSGRPRGGTVAPRPPRHRPLRSRRPRPAGAPRRGQRPGSGPPPGPPGSAAGDGRRRRPAGRV
ncbi:MAG: hypothetical protein AVDCRST_MAG49-4399, partial [uncultured Thermomicrobiales bacterium]